MKSPTFEIKIAFCGYVNSGKSTLVNALLQQKYSEVSMNRNTLGVNSFRIFTKKDTIARWGVFDSVSSSSSKKENDVKVGTPWFVVPENLQTVNEVYQVIANVNSAPRGTTKIEESTFDIEVPEAICDMREDTQLVVLDLPGFTFDESDHAYKSYLCTHWDSFDCVVVVLDVTETSNKQLEFINLVKDNLKQIKDIPVIFACNKVDNPYDPELNTKLDELEPVANCIFLQNGTFFICQFYVSPAFIYLKTTCLQSGISFSFITICAKDAFIYRASSGKSYRQFHSLDMEWIEKNW
jgi:GTPase SAR1 family protein